jgi:hypothetical protein
MNGAANAKFDIYTGSGNLTIDGRTRCAQVLANGELQYVEKQGVPTQSVVSSSGQATLTLKSSDAGQPWLRFPWQACNGATEWQIHINPSLPADIIARSGGGNVNLDLAGMALTQVYAETGGGSMNLVLPENAANLSVTAKTGAGNVVVCLPGGIAARVQAVSGLGKVMLDERFIKIDNSTYQTPDYNSAANKVEITLKSGAGNVIVQV